MTCILVWQKLVTVTKMADELYSKLVHKIVQGQVALYVSSAKVRELRREEQESAVQITLGAWLQASEQV